MKGLKYQKILIITLKDKANNETISDCAFNSNIVTIINDEDIDVIFDHFFK